MDKVPEYKFLDEMSVSHDTCPIRIMEGQFSGIVYKYGKISLEEVEGENLKVNMDITMVEAPDGFNQQDEEFTQTIGKIFVDIIEQNAMEITQKDPVDLEDDVHQD